VIFSFSQKVAPCVEDATRAYCWQALLLKRTFVVVVTSVGLVPEPARADEDSEHSA
jgi:hypothetical protein